MSSWFSAFLAAAMFASSLSGITPSGRTVQPAGFAIGLGNFPTDAVASPDGRFVAVADEGLTPAIELVDVRKSVVTQRIDLPALWGSLMWTDRALYAGGAYSGHVYRFSYDPKARTPLARGEDLALGTGLVGGVAVDESSRTLYAARTQAQRIDVVDLDNGSVRRSVPVGGQPYDVVLAGGQIAAALYNSDAVAFVDRAGGAVTTVTTGAHPTRLLARGDAVFAANADGEDAVEIAAPTHAVVRRFVLSDAGGLPGATPAGLALDADGSRLYLAVSGLDEVAVFDRGTGNRIATIPAGWYPDAIALTAPATEKRRVPALWIADGKGIGVQPDPEGEWDGTYTGLLQHLSLKDLPSAPTPRAPAPRPVLAAHAPVKHVVIIVKENKQVDEEFSDIPGVMGDMRLLVYGRHFTPNAHRLAEQYTIADWLDAEGEGSEYGHAWLTNAFANDYLQRNSPVTDHAGKAPRVAWSIWPRLAVDDKSIPDAAFDYDGDKDLRALGIAPRANPAGIFGPNGEIFDAAARAGISFRVYGEQLRVMADGTIDPLLKGHLAENYPGAHIDFDVLDTQRAKLFLDDLRTHGLAALTYMTLPDDHTAGNDPGYYTPESFVANNDEALGQIIAGLSRRPEWKDTLVFITFDDPQGTGDHLDDHRVGAIVVGGAARRNYVSHARYSHMSILRTTEALLGLHPLTINDAYAAPMDDVIARQPTAMPYAPVVPDVPMRRNPGMPRVKSFPVDNLTPPVH
ncbi:MAG TPA: bifunctional YncE family protein/alkaline phosphatase family protein [Candidatus Limnocylindria bacterium]|nr:bifunctional YncE family protein/alkaline phosphatase family protein [Candidatus Limnocylindria bacterium]